MEDLKKQQGAKQEERSTNYFDFSEVFRYYFRKKDPNNKPNTSLKIMHGINKISIIMFLIAFVVWLVRRLM